MIANLIEDAIDNAVNRNGYDEIVLIGHSMGGMLLRKVLLWGGSSSRGVDRRILGQNGLEWEMPR